MDNESKPSKQAVCADLQKHKCGSSRLNHSDGKSLFIEFKDGSGSMINC